MKTPSLNRSTFAVNASRAAAVVAARRNESLSITDEDKAANRFIWINRGLTVRQMQIRETDDAREARLFNLI
jgi:hypothetical protein